MLRRDVYQLLCGVVAPMTSDYFRSFLALDNDIDKKGLSRSVYKNFAQLCNSRVQMCPEAQPRRGRGSPDQFK